MLLALVLALLAPMHPVHAALVADASPAPQSYRTQLRPRFQAFGYTGELKLIFSSDGYVNGTYRPDTGGRLTMVRGGRQGKHIWFDLPTLGGVHVEATIDDSGITGVGSALGPSNREYIFTATPESSPSPSP